jgi:RNA polymerase sigma factor (sigma-70 family)
MERGVGRHLQNLMIRLADGDRSAFHPLFTALWPIVRRFTGRHLPPPEAEDAAQETLLKLFRQASRFDPTRSAVAWALGVAGFEIRTARRRRLRRREDPALSARLGERSHPARDPEAEALAGDLESALRDTIGTLRPADVETLRLYALGERPPVAAATFRKRVQRALARLRTAWKETDERT